MEKGKRVYIKRGIDFTLSLLGLILLSFPLIMLGLVIKFIQKGPILYKQPRPGKNHKIFYIYKFRTMTSQKDQEGNLLPDEKRMTNLGKFLRRLSLDELPELWNVLKGEMSLVGPRPLVVQYLDRYTPEQSRRHEVNSGVTGWAQIKGRNEVVWEKRFKYDIWYVENWNLWIDLKIIFITLFNVIIGKGINYPGYATMKEFQGNQKKENESN